MSRSAPPGRLVLLLAGLAVCTLGCASRGPSPRFLYFEPPILNDPWSSPIVHWQQRVRASTGHADQSTAASPVSAALAPSRAPDRSGGPLADAFTSFRALQQRLLVEQVAEWVQGQARSHFVPDGVIDRWPTFEEILRSEGDDCDGLALLAHRILRELGFAPSQLYQGIVHDRQGGQHHMVTFWFEDPEDPWVIDPTGAMVTEVSRMSSIPGWHPVKIFSASEEYSVIPDEAVASGPPTSP